MSRRAFKACSVDGCAKKHIAKGYCAHHYKVLRTFGQCAADGCDADGKMAGLCVRHYTQLRRHGRFLIDNEMSPPEAWLHQHVRHEGSDCLEWPFSMNTDGYGRFKKNQKAFAAHRTMCELAHGAPPFAGAVAAHSCGVSKCVNPNHIRWATPKENTADKLIHGTASIGERSSFAKLTAAQVIQIRNDPRSQSTIAREYGVQQAAISKIKLGRCWKHLPTGRELETA